MIDGVCSNPVDLAMEGGTCDHNMANVPPSTFFRGTEAVPHNLPSASYNKMINSPKSKEYGDEMSGIFEVWSNDFGPAAGIVWFPCAIEKNTRCMWSTDGSSDSRPSTCGRFDPDPSDFFGIIMALEGCNECGATNGPILLAEDNPITNRTVGRYDDLPTTNNDPTSLQIELLYNRQSNITSGNVYETDGSMTKVKERSNNSCELCKSSIREAGAGKLTENETNQIFTKLFTLFELKWYEGLGYYNTLDQEDTWSLIQPRNELKEMTQAQAAHFGINREYSDETDYGEVYYNEWAIDTAGMLQLEEDRSSTLNFEGYDAEGECGAAIKALVLICGDQDDPFYYAEPGQCLDFAEVYKTNFETEDIPPVVYLNKKNITHPFSATCDVEISCGVEKEDSDSEAVAAEEAGEEDTATNNASVANSIPVLFSGYGLYSLTAFFTFIM